MIPLIVKEVFGQASLRLPPPRDGDVRLVLVSPEPNSVVDAEAIDVFLDVKNVEIAPGGHRLVVILGSDMRQTVTHVLRPATFRGLKPGSYLLRAFVVDRRGALVRSPGAMVTTFVHIKRPDEVLPRADVPILTVASPEGFFFGEDARLILFDFVTSNLRLGERGLRLRYRIGDFTGYVYQNNPVLLTELRPGEYVLRAEVVGENNEPLRGPYLSAECQFTVLPPPLRAVVVKGEQAVAETSNGTSTHSGDGSDSGEAAAGSLDFEQLPRVRVVSPEPGLTVLQDDPAWQD